MGLNYFGENEVAQKNRLKKSVGHDGLSNEVLTQGSPVIGKDLSEALNNSIIEKTTSWKICYARQQNLREAFV